MYRWCAYCQQYQGEKAPFEDHALTHGICESCLSKDSLGDEESLARLQPIIAFSADIQAMAQSGRSVPVDEVVGRGRSLGMRPVDLLVGILQPTLYDVGRRWEKGELEPHIEAAFSAFSDELTTALEREQRSAPLPPGAPVVVLMNARWNRHTLGLRMATFLLREQGLDAQALLPIPPRDELVGELIARRPAVVGVSLATGWQLPFLDEVLEAVKFVDPRPRVVAGGAAVRAGCELPPGVESWPDHEAFAASLGAG